MGLGKLHKHIQKNKIRPLFYTLTIISSKWTKDLSVVPKTVKFLEENIGKNPDTGPKVQRAKINIGR